MDERIPLPYQIACLILAALFLWSFSVAREPRGWRRLFQSMFSKSEFFSVNKNKVIDESLKRYGILVAMFFLVAAVTCFVIGVTSASRARMKELSPEEWHQIRDIQKATGGSGGIMSP